MLAAVVVAAAGIDKHITAHCFRHGLNDLVRKTSGDVAARGMLGHVTEEMTVNYSDVDMTEKAEMIAKALGQLPDPKHLVVQKRTPVVLSRALQVPAGEKLGMAGGDDEELVGTVH